MTALAALALLVLLCSCASKPIKLSGGLGPNASFEYGGGETKSLLSNLVGSTPDGQQATPPPGVLVVMAGPGMAATGTFSTAQPVPSHQASYTNQTPPDFLSKLGDWLAPDPPDNAQPEK